MRRSIHIVRPPVVDGLDLDILESYRVYDHFALAAELWRLAARPERASAIEELVLRAYDYDVPLLTTPDIEELLGLLTGLDDAIYGAIANERHEIPLDQLPALLMEAAWRLPAKTSAWPDWMVPFAQTIDGERVGGIRARAAPLGRQWLGRMTCG